MITEPDKCRRCKLCLPRPHDIYCVPCRVAVDDDIAGITGSTSSRALESLAKPGLLVLLVIVAASLVGCGSSEEWSPSPEPGHAELVYSGYPDKATDKIRVYSIDVPDGTLYVTQSWRCISAVLAPRDQAALARAKIQVPADLVKAMERLVAPK